MKKNSTYFFILLVFFSQGLASQNENTKWYFGSSGLNFMTVPPTVLSNLQLTTIEACASVANGAGNLLFYTNGANVWNQSHVIMANGSGLNGSFSSSQMSVVKQPGNPDKYYIFHINGLGGLCYSIVDMGLAAGMGSVTVKNATVFVGSTEKITAVKHCNGIDVWIVTHYVNSNAFRAQLLTSSGLNPAAVVTSYGTNHADPTGCMKASPNGKKIGLAITSGGTPYTNGTIELYDFDNLTGVVSNSLSLLTSSADTPYGVEFSPDGSKFYGSAMGGVTPNSFIVQWDLCAGSNTAIAASSYSFGTNNNGYASMQLAPNGKVYVARPLSTALGVINNPNFPGIASNYVNLGQAATPQCKYGLPDYVRGPAKTTIPTFSYSLSDCRRRNFTALPSPTVSSIINCTPTVLFNPTGFSWDFGDPSSGTANTSLLANPSHFFSSTGTFTVQLIISYANTCSDTVRQVVNVTLSCISVNSTSITCASLGSATVTASAGLGPYNYTWMPGNQTSSVATGLSPGTYTVVVFDIGNNFTYSDTTVFTSLIPLTGNLNNSNTITCNGASTGTANYTNFAGGSGNQNYIWTSGSLSYTVPNPINLSAGSWSSTVTDALTGCTINNTFLITQPPALTLNIIASTPTACVGTNVVLSGTNTGGTAGYNYTWTAGPPLATQIITQLTGGVYVYTLNSTDANNCAISRTISVGFIINPTITVSDFSICPLQTATLNAFGASSYTWNTSNTGSTFSHNPLSTTQYSVIGAALGCTAAATASIILKPVPVPTLTTNGPRCNGDDLLLSADGGAAYTWSGPLAYNSSIQNPTINPVGVLNAGVYNLTVTAANGCTASINNTVVVNPTPTLSAMGSTVCSIQTMSLFANSVAGANYTWFGPQGFSATSQNVSVVSPLIIQSGNYTIVATSSQGCTNTAVVNASIVAPPSPTAALSSNSTCAQALSGSPNNIVLSSSGANTYTLSVPNHIYNPNPGGPNSPLSLVPPYNPTGPATATLYGSNGVCTVSTSATFSIIPNPTVSVSSPTPVICAGQSFTYTSAGANSYTWSAANPGNTLYTTGNVAVANPSINSVFSVIGGSLGCNSAIQNLVLTVNPLPQLTVNPVSICKNNSVQLSALSNGTSFTWSPFQFLSSEFGQSVIANPPATQNYQVVASLNNCTVSAITTVSVLPLPVALIVAPETTFCKNEKIILSGSSTHSISANSYQWQGPSGYNSTGQSIEITALSDSFNGIYTLTVKDQNNCKGNATMPITVYDLPQAYLTSSNTNGCAPLCTQLKLRQANGSAVLTETDWQLGHLHFDNDFFYCFDLPGNYPIVGTLKDINGCANTVTSEITVYPKPTADFDFTPLRPVENFDEVQFSGLSTTAISYNWHFGTVNFNSPLQNPRYLFENTGYYPVVLVVKNEWQCSDTIIKTLYVEPDFAVYVPNAFTPNEDGLNESFIPVLRGVKDFTFLVFDRWGAKIFETNDLTKGWDGQFKGEACQQGIYVWKLNVSAESSDATKGLKVEKNLTGNVTLNR